MEEYLDFKNPNYDLIEDSFIKNKIQEFLSNDIMSNINNSNIYKEYEFIYTEEDKEVYEKWDKKITEIYNLGLPKETEEVKGV